MSDTVLFVLFIAIAVIVMLHMLQCQPSSSLIKADKNVLEPELKTRGLGEKEGGDSHHAQIIRTKLIGKENEIKIAQRMAT
jgi:hypothetical protein